MRQVDQAVTYFKQLGEVDPYRLDNLDTYSNLLYVKEQRVELAHLAHRTNMIDKYRTETCCVIGMAGFYYPEKKHHTITSDTPPTQHAGCDYILSHFQTTWYATLS